MNIADDFSREAPAIEVDTSLGGVRVTRVLNRLKIERGLPQQIRSDNGPEFISKAVEQWAYENGVDWHFIEPGKPIENAYIESFNARFRDECLNENWFIDLADARQKIEDMEAGLQPAASAQLVGLPDAGRVCASWRRRAVEKTAAEPPWKTLRVSHFPTAPATVESAANLLRCPTRRDSHYDWYKNGGQISSARPTVLQGGQFFFVAAFGSVVNVTIASLVASYIHPPLQLEHIWPSIAALVGAGCTSTFNFLGYKYFVFASTSIGSEEASVE